MSTAISAIDELAHCAANAVRHYLRYCGSADPAAHVQTNLGIVRGLADAAITDATGAVPDRPRVHNVTLTGDGAIRITFDAAGKLQRTVALTAVADDQPPTEVVPSDDGADNHHDAAGTDAGPDSIPNPAATARPVTPGRDHHATYTRRNAAAIAAGYSSYGARRAALATGCGLLPCDQL